MVFEKAQPAKPLDEVAAFIEHIRTFNGQPNPNDPMVTVVDGVTYVRQDLEGGPWLRYRTPEEYNRLAALGRKMVDDFMEAAQTEDNALLQD